MLKWLIRRRLAAFERSFGYDVSYLRALMEADFGAFRRYAKVAAAGQYRGALPAVAWFAAKLATVMAEDCGPCTQLGVRMAERAGVPAPTLRAILAGDPAAMPADAALAFRFTRATLAHDPAADALRDEVVVRWGKAGLAALALAVTIARTYPTLKYGLGYGQACSRVTVGGEVAPLPRQAA